jgi:methionyl-tRNA formyltransferase
LNDQPKKLRLAFAGSPEFAARILSVLQTSSVPCEFVLTQPDRPRGRGRKLMPNPVKSLATDLGLPVYQPTSLRDPESATPLQGFAPDVLIVAAYGLLLPEHVLNIPTHGCINVHASLLPRWRGAAPIERAVMAGDSETGVAIMQMEKGLDTGPVFARESLAIGDCENIEVLENQLADTGAHLLIDVLKRLPQQPEPQSTAGITYAHKLTAADRLIDWASDASDIARQIWALSHRMPALTTLGQTQVQILEATATDRLPEIQPKGRPGRQARASKKSITVECGSGWLQVARLKINRGKGLPMDAAAARNGYPDVFQTDAVFSNPVSPASS